MIVNQKKDSNTLKIHKGDTQDPTANLSGAEFKVTDEGNTADTQTTPATDSSGNSQITTKSGGDQTLDLSETKAPDGYSMLSDSYEVHLTDTGVTGVRKKGDTTWATSVTDPNGSIVKVDKNQLSIADQKNGKITIRDYDQSTGKYMDADRSYTGPVNSTLSSVTKDFLPTDRHDGLVLWGVTTDSNFPKSGTLDDYNPTSIGNMTFGKDDLTITYVFNKQMFEIDPDKTIDFGNFNPDQGNTDYDIGEMSSLTGQQIPFGISVTDRIGYNHWTLDVSQDGQFKNDANNGTYELSNSDLWFKNMNIKGSDHSGGSIDNLYNYTYQPDFSLGSTPNPNDKKQILDVSAMPDPTTGTTPAEGTVNKPNAHSWRIDFGHKLGQYPSGGTSVGLHVPKTTVRQAGHYSTTLTWEAKILP